MPEITDLFEYLLSQHQSFDDAESEFRRMLVDDIELRRQYRAWCSENEESEKHGFNNYCRMRADEMDDRYQALADEDDDY